MKKTESRMDNRKIIHIDMDAFYASVEQRDRPEYQGNPVIVGGAPDRRGVVAACSYEARKFGIHSAMPSARAVKLCPHAIFIKPRFDEYRRISEQIRGIFRKFTELVEPLSLDEAYLDVSDCDIYQGSATRIAQAVKAEIKAVTGLTASAGVSYNKFLAKVASDMDKPDGLYVITPVEGESFVGSLPIGKFFGIGKATETRMKALNITTGADLKLLELEELRRHFGKTGDYFYHIARGIDLRAVSSSRERKSISSETTFMEDLFDVKMMIKSLQELAEDTLQTLVNKELTARTLTIKVKYADFRQVTRSKTMTEPFTTVTAVRPVLAELLAKTEAGRRRVRLLGVGVSNLHPVTEAENIQQIALL